MKKAVKKAVKKAGKKATPPVNRKLRDGDPCDVVEGTHKGKSGFATDIKFSKSGHMTITVVQKNGDRFKTLGRNVVVRRAG